MNNNGKFGTFILGSAIGGLMGAAAMLLTAPQSGEETQDLIRSRVTDLRKDAEGTITNGRHSAETIVNDARNSLANWLQRSASALEQQAEEVRPSS